MSSIPQNHSDEKALVDCVQRFFSKHHVGGLLARCNGMKEKGVSPVSLLRYKLSNIFVGRSMYMQQISSIMTSVICQITEEKMSSSLMIVFSTVPAVRKQNWDQKFLTTRICISKRGFGCLL